MRISHAAQHEASAAVLFYESTGFAFQFGLTDEHLCPRAVVTTTPIVLTARACQNDMWSNPHEMQNKRKNLHK